MRLLFLTRSYAAPPETGVEIRTAYLVRALSAVPGTSIRVLHHPWGTPAACEDIPNVSVKVCPSAWRLRYELLRSQRVFDLALVDTCALMPHIAGLCLPVIVNEHNVEYEIMQQGGDRRAHRWRWAEEQMWRTAEGVITCCERDAEIMKGAGAHHVAVVPNILDVMPGRPGTRRAPAPTVLFAGTFSYWPNQEGLRWLLEQVWPLVRSQVPGATLIVAGRNARRVAHLCPEGVQVISDPPVAAMTALEASAAVAVSPLFSGGGTKYKIIKAIAAGCPVVAVGQSVEGLDGLDLAHVRVADTAAGFAGAVVAALGATTEGLAPSAQWLARYDWRTYTAPLGQFVSEARRRWEATPLTRRAVRRFIPLTWPHF